MSVKGSGLSVSGLRVKGLKFRVEGQGLELGASKGFEVSVSRVKRIQVVKKFSRGWSFKVLGWGLGTCTRPWSVSLVSSST